MARRKIKGAIPEDEHLDSLPTLDMMADGMERYGKYILENRSIPDFRDGLKPVQRRILWAMHGIGLSFKTAFRKSSQTVGETLAKYHPHGDSACYDAMVSMVHWNNPCVDGQGNFGDLLHPAAAPRYTEARLTEYSCANFFDGAFVPVIDTADTYDGSGKEPVVLPSLLPNLLLNGAFGIGVGAICSIPAFEKEGVLALTKKALRGKKVTIENCMEKLQPMCAEGADADLQDAYNVKGLREFYETGRGRVKWEPEAEGDIDDRMVIIKGFAPRSARLGLQSSLEKTKEDDNVQSVLNESDLDTGIVYKVEFKQKVPKTRLEAAMQKVCGYFTTTQALVLTVTKRFPPEEEGAEADVAFDYVSMPKFFELWAKWRIGMERRAIVHKRRLTEERIDRDSVLLLAAVNREVVFQSLKVDDSTKFLMKKLDIEESVAKTILELRVRQLKVLEEKALRQRIAEAKKRIKDLKKQYDNPVPAIEKAMEEVA